MFKKERKGRAMEWFAFYVNPALPHKGGRG